MQACWSVHTELAVKELLVVLNCSGDNCEGCLALWLGTCDEKGSERVRSVDAGGIFRAVRPLLLLEGARRDHSARALADGSDALARRADDEAWTTLRFVLRRQAAQWMHVQDMKEEAGVRK